MNDLADAVQRVAESARTLVELEVELAIAELKRKAATLGIGLGLSGGALMFLWVAILFGLGSGDGRPHLCPAGLGVPPRDVRRCSCSSLSRWGPSASR